jgi:zinc and cadmium transporter
MDILLFALAASLAALVGGYAAFKTRHKIYLAMGFTAGLIIGLVAFDLFPEIFNIVKNTGLDSIWPMITFVIGFFTFHIVEKFILLHEGSENQYGPHHHPNVGVIGAVALSGHSFLDGLSIGLAFQVNTAVGLAVGIAVVGHRFADGFNTTNVMLYHKNSYQKAKKLLYIAVLMPMFGAFTTFFISPSEKILAVYLGFFAGFLMYIGASDILPQAHSQKSSRKTIALTVIGVVFIFLITRLAD